MKYNKSPEKSGLLLYYLVSNKLIPRHKDSKYIPEQ